MYLTVLDGALAEAGYWLVRYADDALIFSQSEKETAEALSHAKAVPGRLRLELDEEKARVSSFDEGFDFLWFHFGKRGRSIARKSLKAFYGKVCEVTKRQQRDKPVKAVIEALNPLLRDWTNYHCEGRNVGMFTHLAKGVRKCLRSYIHKRWRVFNWPKENKPTEEEYAGMGLFSLRRVLRLKPLQLVLFPAPQ